MYVGMGLQATHLTLTFSRTNLFRKDYCMRARCAPYQVSRYGIGRQGMYTACLTHWPSGTNLFRWWHWRTGTTAAGASHSTQAASVRHKHHSSKLTCRERGGKSRWHTNDKTTVGKCQMKTFMSQQEVLNTVQSSEEFEINSAYKPQITLHSYVVNEVIPQ